MPASVSPSTIAAADATPEPNHNQGKAIRVFRKRGSNPLTTTPGHIQEGDFALGSLEIICDLMNAAEQRGIDLEGHISAFRDLGKADYVHYAGIIVNMPRETLLKGDQAVDKDMSARRASSGDPPSQLPNSAVPTKRKRAESEATDKENTTVGADEQSTMPLLEDFCGIDHGCRKLPDNYQYPGSLLSHVKNKHSKNLPSKKNPIWCCNTPYADMKLYADHYLDTHKVSRAVVPGAMSSAARAPENDSPSHHDHNLRNTRSASLSVAALPPKNVGPAHALSNDHAAERLPSSQNVGTGHYLYSQSPPDMQTWPSSQFSPPTTFQNGFPANHSQQQQTMRQNYPAPGYQQTM